MQFVPGRSRQDEEVPVERVEESQVALEAGADHEQVYVPVQGAHLKTDPQLRGDETMKKSKEEAKC